MPLNRDVVLKFVVGIHFLFTMLVLMVSWLPPAYDFVQMIVIFLGLWSIINNDNAVIVELLIVAKSCSIAFDAIAIGMYFHAYRGSYFVFSATFAIFLLMLKLPMLLLLNKVRQARLGDAESPTFGGWGLQGGHVPGYQPVGENPATFNP